MTASDSVGPNSVGPNSIGPNSIGPNSIGPNSIGPNSIGPGPVSVDEVITVVIVDDHLLMANTVAMTLATTPDITVLGVADSCAGGLAAITRHRPDVVLLDQRLPDGSGTDVLPAMLDECPQMRVLVVTGVDSDDVVLAAIAAGAAGVIAKGRRFDALLQAVRDAAHDEAVVAPDVLRRLLPRLPHRGGTAGADLTGQERAVLGLLVEGMRTVAIADTLGVTVDTARENVRAVIVKMGSHTRLGAVAVAMGGHVVVAP